MRTKRLLLASVFALLLVAAFRREAASQSSLIQQVAPGVYFRVAEPAKRIIANTGWVLFRDYILVIDANFPWGARAALESIRKTTDKPIRFVFDTHYHGDHAFGNSVFVDAGATILCSDDCIEESKVKNTVSWNKDAATGEFSLRSYRLEHPQIGFRDKLVLDDGTRRVELVRVGPGHTRGDAVAWLPKERVLFTGDLCVNRPGNNIADPDADPDGWLRALDALLARDVAVVIPGHGDEGTKNALLGQRAYLADMINKVRDGIGRGVAVTQLEKEIDLSQHKPWGQDAARNTASIRAVYAKLNRR
jgi:glyoxylase-like metal-dependent hydrolase (beta-lactamase superfamily II)